jgi:hypothetical protein
MIFHRVFQRRLDAQEARVEGGRIVVVECNHLGSCLSHEIYIDHGQQQGLGSRGADVASRSSRRRGARSSKIAFNVIANPPAGGLIEGSRVQ